MKGQSPLRVNFTIQASTGALVGTVSDGLHTTDCRAWPAMSAPFGGYTGYYTAGLKLLNAGDVGVAGIPQGHGYAYFNVGATGAATGVIRMGDGSQVPLSATLRSNGGLVLFTPLYGGTGSILGTLNLAPGSPVLVQTAGLNWVKLSQSVFTRSYPAGFGPLPLQAAGARYTVPTGSMIIMNLVSSADDVANAALEFAQGVVDGRDAHMGDPRRDLKRNLRRLDYVLEKFGITVRKRGATGHGLRHEVLNDAYEDITGVPSPVRGGGPVSPELDRAARLAVSQLAGHARARAAGAYIGTIIKPGGRPVGSPEPKRDDDDGAAVPV